MLRWIATITVLLGTCAAAAPVSMNLARAFSDTKSLLSSQQSADILVLGDSLSFREGSYLPYFRSAMQARYGDGGYGYQGLSLWTGGAFTSGWLNPVVNTDVAPHHSMDGLWNQYDGTSAFPNLAEITPVNRSITLQYLRGPGRGSFSITTQSGQTIASLTSNVSDTDIGNFQLVLPPGDTEYHILPHRNGPLTFLGQNNVSGQQGVRIHRAANGGWGVENFLQRDFTFDLQTQSIGPEMVMVWLGQNDQSYNRQTYAVALNQLVDRIQTQAPAAEIVLVGTYDQGSPLLAPLVEAMADVAGNRNLGFLNLFRAAGDAAFFAENGYLDDGIHFSPAGGQYVADLMYNAFLTDGRSLKHREFATAESSLLIKQQEFLSRGSVPEPSAGLIIAGLTRFLFARGKKLSRN